jgi:hypothetical protein
MVAFLESILWVLFQHVLDLLGPSVDGVLKNLGFVLAGGLFT